MKFKYMGPQDEITLRGVTFAKGEAVELDPENQHEALLAAKIAVIDGFEEVKAGRPKKDSGVN